MFHFRKKSGIPSGEPAAPAVAPLPENTVDGGIEASVTQPVPSKQSWLERLRTGLRKTGSNLSAVFVGAKVDASLFQELENALLLADAGVDATSHLMSQLRADAKRQKIETAPELKRALAKILTDLLLPLQKSFDLERAAPIVVMIAGVNGAGKTTSIGKLAKYFQQHGKSVLLAAADTFRAAAREQLTIWGKRNDVHVVAQEGGDPAAVAFDAVASARARRIGVMMVDTAGRLPTQANLMEELKKIRRVVSKAMADAPHETLLVIDGNTGQNALAQVKAFDAAIGLSGLIITKLDGTAKGGVIAAIAKNHPIPIYFVGIGEGLEDLQPFDAPEFVDALLQ